MTEYEDLFQALGFHSVPPLLQGDFYIIVRPYLFFNLPTCVVAPTSQIHGFSYLHVHVYSAFHF